MCQKTCRTCTQPVDKPYRMVDATGKILYGCIVADHNDYIATLDVEHPDHVWHWRQQAIAIRKMEVDRLRLVTGR